MKKPKYIPGDWVMFKGEKMQVIDSLRHTMPDHYEYEVKLNRPRSLWVKEDELVPIRLTEPILKSISDGKVYTYCDFCIKGKLYIETFPKKEPRGAVDIDIFSNVSPESYDVVQDDFYLTSVSYVHELQHLLYALNIEVEVKL